MLLFLLLLLFYVVVGILFDVGDHILLVFGQGMFI